MPGPRLESILGHCERHALLHMAPKWFDHWTTWAGPRCSCGYLYGARCIWSSCCHRHSIISCFIRVQNGLTFPVPAYTGCPGKEAVKWVSACLSAIPMVQCIGLSDLLWGWGSPHSRSSAAQHYISAGCFTCDTMTQQLFYYYICQWAT